MHVWTFFAGMLLSTLLHRASFWYQETRRAYQAEKVQASQALEASKRSLSAQRGRFERALGVVGDDELASTSEETYDDEPQTSLNDDMGRSTEEVFDPRWEYDKDAMREWESFIKQSKSAQLTVIA
ncbi:hypothetical protein COCSUDRAFT_58454 [Coccomyxa subellipsoidea C-169]|uniref:Uncharacterized protein n=1 Tax=Coccomyxa subellipsoidea (strain C-169) TaxID=574566 RepID=I0YMV2_COCSC|nr:hypothetical protein COCSUDRAFT_58454 [Coccomyxa subellipsoidea C-169]EIE19721.1 hypothetical protein COCSUDRAFT_58454 [Coccomyxa subellipsoidea C-169]|eukprot:XP_005644265.1 hypothetical protein COCSUDRAFT_58454 [Coccomyxa subellipsoidea C-169]